MNILFFLQCKQPKTTIRFLSLEEWLDGEVVMMSDWAVYVKVSFPGFESPNLVDLVTRVEVS